MVNKPLNFKEWLKDWYAIDHDRWVPEMTDETNKIWRDGYERYLKEWEGKNEIRRCRNFDR